MRAGEARTADFATAAEALPKPEDFRVLIADDSAVTRRVMSALVSTIAPGIAIVEAANGADTGEALRRGVFDVAFVDFHMPDMSGPRAVSLARRVGANPLVVMMGDGPEDAADRMLRAASILTSSCRSRWRSASYGRYSATSIVCVAPRA